MIHRVAFTTSLDAYWNSTTFLDFPQSFAQFDQFFGDEFQSNMALSTLVETPCVFAIEEHTWSYTIPCEVVPEMFLHINTGLSENQQE